MSSSSISVVIPYFNDLVRIKRCLLSVLKQTHLPLEIILVDDGSADSGDLIKLLDTISFNSVNFIYIRNEINRNGAYSRNLGIKKASGNYIALLDADDYWLQSHLEYCIKHIKGSHFDFLYSNVLLELPYGLYSRKSTDINTCVNKFDLLLKKPPQTNSFFFRSDIFNLVQFDEKLNRHQDTQFLFDLINKGVKMKYLNVNTAIYSSSHRPLLQRVNIKHSLSFWEHRAHFFTVKLLKKRLVRMMLTYLEVDEVTFLNEAKKRQLYNFVFDSYRFKLFLKLRHLNFITFKSLVKVFYLKEFIFISKLLRLRKFS